ncbi:MAG: GNAT family N-acetyltransferase [Planctomycetota bacterium]
MTTANDPIDAAIDVVPAGAGFDVRRTTNEDREWIRSTLRRYWASERVLTRGRAVDAMTLPGFAAFKGDEPVGVILYNIEGDQCEIVTHNSLKGSGGIGSCLLAAVRQEARQRGCSRLWCVTTNDNTPALRFYQRRDFDLCALHRHAVTANRHLKPEIPDEGLDGIQIRHEVELEYLL